MRYWPRPSRSYSSRTAASGPQSDVLKPARIMARRKHHENKSSAASWHPGADRGVCGRGAPHRPRATTPPSSPKTARPFPIRRRSFPTFPSRLVQECAIVNIFGNGSIQYVVNYRSRPYDPATADVCSVTIRMKGYQTMHATLRNDATIVLKRIGLHEGSTVSATALNAPEPAKKAYGKGVNAMNDEKWAAAQKNFEKAVEIDPDYAQAWSDLGEVLQEASQTHRGARGLGKSGAGRSEIHQALHPADHARSGGKTPGGCGRDWRQGGGHESSRISRALFLLCGGELQFEALRCGRDECAPRHRSR